jgi:hypothetical protein
MDAVIFSNEIMVLGVPSVYQFHGPTCIVIFAPHIHSGAVAQAKIAAPWQVRATWVEGRRGSPALQSFHPGDLCEAQPARTGITA